MTYQITFNGHKGFHQEKIRCKNLEELFQTIMRLCYEFGEPFEMIYLIDGRS